MLRFAVMGRELSRLRVARLMLVRSAAAAGLLVLMHVPLQAACALQLPEARFEAAVSVSREKGMSGVSSEIVWAAMPQHRLACFAANLAVSSLLPQGAGRGPWTAPHKGSVLRHATTARPARNLGVSVFLNTPRFHRRCIRLSMSSPGAGSEGGKARTESREETGEIALTELRESGESGIPTREVSLSGFLSGLPFGLNRYDPTPECIREEVRSGRGTRMSP